ncbi:hypothetical protein V8E55_004232 [Tylopilus felleus]
MPNRKISPNLKYAALHKHWTHFYSTLQLAINRAAHKRTYRTFRNASRCGVRKSPMVQRASLTRYRDIWRTRYTYAFAHLILVPADSGTCQACSETLFRDLDVRESIDILPRVVTDVRARKQRQPRAALCARTVPGLESEVEKLKAASQSLEEENLALFEQIKSNVQRRREADAKSAMLLEAFDDVYSKWCKVPHDEISLWVLQAAENLPPTKLV